MREEQPGNPMRPENLALTDLPSQSPEADRSLAMRMLYDEQNRLRTELDQMRQKQKQQGKEGDKKEGEHQTLLGYDATSSGFAVSRRGLGSIASSIGVGVSVSKMDPRKIVAAGFAFFGGSGLWLSFLTLDISSTSLLADNRERLRSGNDFRTSVEGCPRHLG